MIYYVYRESFEIDARIPKESVIEVTLSNDLLNEFYEEIGVYNTLAEAKAAAEKVGSYLSTSGKAGGKYWLLDLCYIQEYDEIEDEPTGEFYYADIK